MPKRSKYRPRDFQYSAWTAPEHVRNGGRYITRRRGELVLEEPACLRLQREAEERKKLLLGE